MRSALPEAMQMQNRIQIECARSGDWIYADELKAAALGALEAGADVTVCLHNIEHLNASALEILLALDAEQKKRGRCLELADVSKHLRQWFDYAGAWNRFRVDEAENDTPQ